MATTISGTYPGVLTVALPATNPFAKVQSNHLTISYGTGGPTSGAPGSPYMMLQAS